jgi:hypothetical protein
MKPTTEYLSNDFLTGIASHNLRICVTDPRLSLRKLLAEKDPKILNAKAPKIVYTTVFTQHDDIINLDIRLKIRWNCNTCYPRFSGIVNSDNNMMKYIRAESLLRNLNEFVNRTIGGNGQLILIIDNLHRIPKNQVGFLTSLLKHSKLNFGVIISTHSKFIETLQESDPLLYSEFCINTDACIRSKLDLQTILSKENIIDGIKEIDSERNKIIRARKSMELKSNDYTNSTYQKVKPDFPVEDFEDLGW